MSKIGQIVLDEWLKTQKLRPYIELDEFVIMPNHFHGIIVIKDNDFDLKNCRDAVHRVSTTNRFGPLKPKSLSSIINTFKGAVSRNCHKNDLDFLWQDNYYEHIIKNDEDYARIKGYIANNPVNWQFDKNNPKNLNK
ncbi:MAG: transposase [Patescibacteria group bacterium]|nr:transposase [Patescibacteria group bacterium]